MHEAGQWTVIKNFKNKKTLPELEPELEGGPRGRCEWREVGREATPPPPAATPPGPPPYSEVEETERVVSAGR